MSLLSLLYGSIVGFSLGLTGGGGAIFAVPLLVYGLGIPARDAVAISLSAVGATSLIGFIHRFKRGEVEVRTGLLFAVAGMFGAPVGTWVAGFFNEALLLLLFAFLMIFVALRMWQKASRPLHEVKNDSGKNKDGAACQRDATGRLLLSSRCAGILLIMGIVTGVLSGMFGVGGGFIIVPALVLFSGISIHRAVGTSLMVIALVSVSGVASQLWAGHSVPLKVTLLFVAGGIAGLFAGQRTGQRLSGPNLQRVFAVAILAVAAFVILRASSS